VFLYFEISFFAVKCSLFGYYISCIFLAFFPISANVLIHSLVNVMSFGGLGICLCGWFCRLVISGFVLQLELWVVILMVFLIMWYVDNSFFHSFWSFLGR
jgi:hypothetical protein